jgi:hypothetical protein
LNQELIEKNGNAGLPEPFTPDFLRAHEALMQGDKPYPGSGQCKACGARNPLAFDKRPTVPRIDAPTFCTRCGGTRIHRILELCGEAVQAPLDIQAPPSQVTTRHLQCTVCHSETAISLTSEKAALKYIPHHCTVCFPGSYADLTLHTVKAA